MKLKLLALSVMACTILSGAAMAGSASGTSALDDPAKMAPFFTDAGMKTLRSDADFKTAWTAMKPDERTAVLKDCGDMTLNKSHAEFCAMAKKMGS